MANTAALHILSAGVAKKAVEAAAQKWNEHHPEMPANIRIDGSVDLVRSIRSGAPCDLLILADDALFPIMMQDIVPGYIVFAGNRMVLCATDGNPLPSKNWREVLTRPDITFKHRDPYGDPGGYRAVMSLMLADEVEAGLAEKLLQHPGHLGMHPEADAEKMKSCPYMIYYYTNALAQKMEYADLPAVMDLSSDDLAETYAKVSFSVDAEHAVQGSPINHALSIPTTARNPKEAAEFANLFLETDFTALGFIPRRETVGKDIL